MSHELRILALEDDPADAELMGMALRGTGMACSWDRVETKEAFIAALKDFGPDVVLIDHNLPSLDGLEALAIAQEHRPDVPLIFVSGSVGEEFAIETLKRGATDYVLKTRLSRLAPAVQRALRESELRAQRRDAERALRESEERFRMIFENAGVGMSLTGTDGRFLAVNNALCAMLGRRRDELQGLNFAALTHPEDVERSRQWVGRMLAGEPAERSLRKRYLCRDGRTVHAEVSTAIFRDSDGEPRYFITAIQDITPRLEAERAQAEVVQELRRSQAEIEQFNHLVAHDLTEPLRTVTNSLKLLAEAYRGGLDAAADELIGYAVAASALMHGMIGDLLSYSRIAKPAELGRIEPAEVIAQARAGLSAAIEESGAVIEHGDLPSFRANEAQMLHLFLNLIGNAVKFRGPQPPRVRILAEERGGELLFSVEDNGIGIAPKHRDGVFDIFRRLHTRSEYPGNGVGLALCKKIVELHGGRIWVEPKPDAGSCFRFTVPKPADPGPSEE